MDAVIRKYEAVFEALKKLDQELQEYGHDQHEVEKNKEIISAGVNMLHALCDFFKEKLHDQALSNEESIKRAAQEKIISEKQAQVLLKAWEESQAATQATLTAATEIAFVHNMVLYYDTIHGFIGTIKVV